MARKFLLKGQIWIEDFWRCCQCVGRPGFSLFIRSFWPLIYFFKYSVPLFNTHTQTHIAFPSNQHSKTNLYMFPPYSLWFVFYQKYSKPNGGLPQFWASLTAPTWWFASQDCACVCTKTVLCYESSASMSCRCFRANQQRALVCLA